jgi:hypothetical protein
MMLALLLAAPLSAGIPLGIFFVGPVLLALVDCYSGMTLERPFAGLGESLFPWFYLRRLDRIRIGF